jgi:hypothetical protein|tara:strand:+ start:48 stop:416 length:369 start_codon:yes stop_codon:yes gene_type:complete
MQELKQIQEENRKAIILANNPEAKSYEEAFILHFGLEPDDNLDDWLIYDSTGAETCLNEVLNAFKSMELGYLNGSLFQIDTNIDSRYVDEMKIICEWDLTKETLEEQSEKTQREINKLLHEV